VCADHPDVDCKTESPLASRTSFCAAVDKVREYLYAGDCFQTVISRRTATGFNGDPFEVYRRLRSINPSPYMFYLSLDSVAVAGASPEMLVRLDNGEVAVHPIAGTRPRGGTSAEDTSIEQELLSDEKERAEHVMLVDLGRNDIGRVAQPGSVRVSQFMEVERYSHVMHLVSHVTGILRPQLSACDALRACFPAGTVTGAPKIRAMQIIAESERQRRGIYAGALGYLGFDGNMDTCIAIRMAVIQNGLLWCQAGSGIVADSTPEAEYIETENKLAAIAHAVREVHTTCCC